MQSIQKDELGDVHSVQNQKGGVGKSTYANALAYDCANRGYSTALLDLDPQATQTGAFMGYSYGAFSGENISNIANIFSDKEFEPIKITTTKYTDNPDKRKFGQSHYLESEMVIDFFPSNYELLSMIESDSFKRDEKIKMIVDFINSLRTKYDKIIIDSPPSFGIITTAILMCSNSTLVSIPTKNVDTDGMIGYFHQLDKAYEQYNMDQLKKIVILPNMFNKVGVDAKETLNDIKRTPNLLQQTNKLRHINCVVNEAFPQRSSIQEAPSINNSFLVPFIMDFARSKNGDLLLALEKLSKEVTNYSL